MIDNNCVTKCSDEHLSPSQPNNKNSLNGNCNNSSNHPTCSMTSSTLLEVHKGRPVKLTVKVIVPVKDHPNFNFIGKLLGPKGNSLKWLQEETQTKMAILGKGSMRDKKKEEDLQNSGDPKYHHLNEDLHVEISAFAPPAEAYSRVGHALHQVQRFLVPDYYDDIRQQQLRELGVLSVNRKPSGSYHSTESTDNGEEEKDEKDEDEDDPIDQEQGIDEQENENENRVVKCNHENDEAEIYSSQLTSQLKLIKDCHQIHHNQHNHHHHHYNHRKPEQHKTHQNYSTQVGHNFHSQQPFPSNQHHYQHQQLKCPNCLPNLLSSSLGGKLKMTKPVPIKFTSSSLSSSTLEPSSFTCEYEMSTKRCSCPHPFDTENSDEKWNTQKTCKTIRNRFQLMPYSKRTRKLYD